MSLLELSFASREASLSVRRFEIHESVSGLFRIAVTATSKDATIDLETLVGRAAGLRAAAGYKHAQASMRVWTGVCSSIEQAQAEAAGLSTYELTIVPVLWLLTQRRNHRIFQHHTIPDIVGKLCAEWGIEPAWKIDRALYPKLEYRVQYGESDFAFLARLLEEAGIAFVFDEDEKKGSVLRFDDALHRADARPGPPIRCVDNPNQAAEREFVTHVRLTHAVRPGAHVIRDYDFRNPSFPLFVEAPRAAPEERYEQMHYQPGALLVETGRAGDTPAADDKGFARYDASFGEGRATRALDAERLGRRAAAFDTNVIDLRPGTVLVIDGHPNPALSEAARLLVTGFSVEGTPDGEWKMSATVAFAAAPYRPELRTPKPTVQGPQSAVVVGPKGQEIHTDEFGRVRVQFPWDREGKLDDGSSCWIRVSQGWAGTGYGILALPRIGQEVLVGFLAGDPDQPIVAGRVFNNAERVPYKLPEHKTRSTWKSDSSPGSGGFNEILFEDLAGKELVYEQAQKNRRRLVKNDETITVGNDRQWLVKANELETTLQNRTEATVQNRTEITEGNRVTTIGGTREILVKGSETEETRGSLKRLVGGTADLVVAGTVRESVGDRHLTVNGGESKRVAGPVHLSVGGSRDEHVAHNLAIDAGGNVHLRAGATFVIEVGQDFTIKGPGGFLRINAEGVTIKGSLVKVNSGGAPGTGVAAAPVLPERAEHAVAADPARPEVDDVSRTGLAQ